MLLTFFAFSSGCGSSTSSLSGSTSDPDTPADLDIPAIVEAIVGSEITLALDINNNNKPDVLDFDDVQHLHSSTSGTELNAVVPFMFWMDSLPSQYSPDIISIELTAGTDYTFELSRNFADSLGGRIPDINLFDPSGNAITATLTVYPEEQPAVILYTFTPSVSGTYSAAVCNADGNSEGDTDCVLFVYKELHNSKGENGYCARFIITNDDGSITAEASVPEVIQLRKNFLKAYSDYLKKVYGKNPEPVNDITQNLDEYAV